uniref:Uncharacterized protein n=1 Tax=Glossina pallidipes TaxID=7398 RepID=A0A1B0ABY7_GLOPL
MEQNTRKSTEEAINLSTTSHNKTKINGILQNFSTTTIPSPTIASERYFEEVPTTSNSKAIVDAILEDFSTASFTSSRSTPEKHLKEIPKRCYSRKIRKRIQEKSVDAEVNTDPVDDFSSCSSIGDNDDKFRIPANVSKDILIGGNKTAEFTSESSPIEAIIPCNAVEKKVRVSCNSDKIKRQRSKTQNNINKYQK